MPLALFCSESDIEDFLQIRIDNDAAALRAIEGATAGIQNYCHQQLVFVANDVVTLRSRGQDVLIVPEQPVTAVASVVENGVVMVSETDYSWGVDGLLFRWNGPWRLSSSIFGTVVVTYSHGYAVIPQPLREVCIRSASRAYQAGLDAAARRGLGNIQSEQFPDYTVQFAPGSPHLGSSLGVSAAPFLLPSEREMLASYRVKP